MGTRRNPWESFREFFWLVDLAALVLFGFFLLLGAFGVGDSAFLTGMIAVLAILYVGHVIMARRHDPGRPDRHAAQARERRGF